MARKGGGGGGARRSGGNRRSGGHRKARAHRQQGMRRNMRRGMQLRGARMARTAAAQKSSMPKISTSSGNSTGMNLKLATLMGGAGGFKSGGHAGGSASGGFGEGQESHVEAEMAYMPIYDQMDDGTDQIQHHLELLSLEG